MVVVLPTLSIPEISRRRRGLLNSLYVIKVGVGSG